MVTERSDIPAKAIGGPAVRFPSTAISQTETQSSLARLSAWRTLEIENALGGERSRSAGPRARHPVRQKLKSGEKEELLHCAASHGSRQHADTNSPVYRVHCRRITQALADHHSGNPAVIGWQTDNELNTTASTSYSEAAEREFRRWLRDKYVTIEALNFAPRPE